MSEFFIIVAIAFGVFIGFIIFDNRKVFLNKIKGIKLPQIKKEPPKPKDEKPKPKDDPDKQIKEDNLKLGNFKDPKPLENQDAVEPENFYALKKKEEIDLDKIYENLRREETRRYERKYQSDFLDPIDVPNFDKMSIDELDEFMEKAFAGDDQPRSSGLSGEELAKAIKNLPPQIKIMLFTDILKRKDDF